MRKPPEPWLSPTREIFFSTANNFVFKFAPTRSRIQELNTHKEMGVLLGYNPADYRIEAGTFTTGLAFFAECRIHSAKALLHSAKGLPSVALGKPHSVKKVTAKAPLPSVFFRALGKVFAECQKALGKLFETRLEKQRLKIAKHFIFTR